MCGESLLTKVMSLTPTPPGNDFLTKEELGRDELVYPLDLYFCEVCHHVQLGHVVDPKILYQKNYSFKSGDFPLAEKFYDRAVSIPIYPDLTDEEVDKVTEDIVGFIKET